MKQPPAIPASHLDLLDQPILGVLTTLMPDGSPQSSLVWCDQAGGIPRVNTTRQRQKGRNLMRDQRATLLLVDPHNSLRWIEIRARVELSEEGALEHLDALTRAYTDKPCYYGHIYPEQQQAKETRIICSLHPVRINAISFSS